MVSLYEVLSTRTIAGEIDLKDSLLNLQIPSDKSFAKLHWYDFIFRLNVESPTVDLEQLNSLVENGAIPSSTEFFEYR